MIGGDTGLTFWLRYVEAEGGLAENGGDTALVVLPTSLRERHELPEEFTVTRNPDAAREDGAMLLAMGHPVLGRAADDVLAAGDVGHVAVPVPSRPAPEVSVLLERAREQFPIDHGKIDVTGPPTRGVRPVMRVGALVSYTISAEDHYQERVECFLDAVSRRELPDTAAAKLMALPQVSSNRNGDVERLRVAVGEAQRILDARAEQRRTSLSRQVAQAFGAELERADAYYRDVLATIERRRANATADRQQMLEARAGATREERARRIAEIREKYEPAHEIRPYRLHVYDVPVWRLPVDVRRGERRYPMVLEWLIPLSMFADLRCPQCDSTETLVAGKARLGCQSCLAKSPVRATAGRAAIPVTPGSG